MDKNGNGSHDGRGRGHGYGEIGGDEGWNGLAAKGFWVRFHRANSMRRGSANTQTATVRY